MYIFLKYSLFILPFSMSFYLGKPVHLKPEGEEVASFYARYLETDHVKKPQFNKNFFKAFKSVLKKSKDPLSDTITEFKKCDFSSIHNYLKEQSEKRKLRTKAEKEKEKKEKEKIREHYGYAIVDGRKEKIGNFTIEPPGLFLGRGDHPKTGTLKVFFFSFSFLFLFFFFSFSFSFFFLFILSIYCSYE